MLQYDPTQATLPSAAMKITIVAGAVISLALFVVEALYELTWGESLTTRLLSSVPALLIVVGTFRSWSLAQWMISGRPGLLALFALYAAAGSAKALTEALSAPSVGQASLGLVVAASIAAAALLITDKAGDED